MFIIPFESDFHRLPPYYLFSLEPSKGYQHEACQVCEEPRSPLSYELSFPGQESGPTAGLSWPQLASLA